MNLNLCVGIMNNAGEVKEGLGWRTTLSMIVGIGWLIFIILWLAFWGTDYTGYQNVAIFFLSILLIAIILGIPWMSWYFKHQSKYEKEMWQTKGFKSRVWLSAVLGFILGIFNIYWFWIYAIYFSIWQNIAVFIVSVLVIGGILGVYWAPWGMKYGDSFDKPKDKPKTEKSKEKKPKVEDEIDKELSKKNN
jgi:hypothetical protein